MKIIKERSSSQDDRFRPPRDRGTPRAHGPAGSWIREGRIFGGFGIWARFSDRVEDLKKIFSARRLRRTKNLAPAARNFSYSQPSKFSLRAPRDRGAPRARGPDEERSLIILIADAL